MVASVAMVQTAAPRRFNRLFPLLLAGAALLAALAVALFLVLGQGGAGGPGPVVHPDPVRAERIAAADLAAGERLAQQCVVCHGLGRSGLQRSGPTLWAIVGAPKARIEGFGYSPALARAGGVWTEGELDSFLTDPHGFMPGNAMPYDGIRNPDQRADLIGYMRTLHD